MDSTTLQKGGVSNENLQTYFQSNKTSIVISYYLQACNKQ